MAKSAVEVLWTARYDYQPDWILPEHKHAYFQMIYILRGSGRFSAGNRDYRIQPASLFLIKPHCVHAMCPSSSIKTLDVKFVIKDRRFREDLLQAPELVEDSEPMIADIFERVRHEGERRGHLYRELCNVFLTEILFLYLRHSTTEPEGCSNSATEPKVPGDWIMQQVMQFIRDHYAENCDLSQIAQFVRRSDRYVRQHFKEALGISPHQYLQQYRIEKAKELIERSNYSFKEIADLIGFKTVHHFARAFHENCGEPPGGWRRKYQAGICKDVNINPRFVNTILTLQSNTSNNSCEEAPTALFRPGVQRGRSW